MLFRSMVLAHNKSLITYLYDAISHRDMATVGYYVGGMKEEALKESEGKKVIIATYAMASEGLDIKTLTTLIMASPKTDVCQSVGRILRTKHAAPLVIDVVDSHEIFVAQWRKRKAYYTKQKYKIVSISNRKYDEYASFIERCLGEDSDKEEEIADVNSVSLWNVVSDPHKQESKTSKVRVRATSGPPSVLSLMEESLDKISLGTVPINLSTNPTEFTIRTKTRKIPKRGGDDGEDGDDITPAPRPVLMNCLLNIDTS